MKITINEFYAGKKENRVHLFGTEEDFESLNFFIETEDQNDNILLSFEEKDGKIIAFDNDNNVIDPQSKDSLSFEELVKHFTKNKFFGDDVVTNGLHIVAYIKKKFLEKEVIDHIERGCVGRTYYITLDESNPDNSYYKLNITL